MVEQYAVSNFPGFCGMNFTMVKFSFWQICYFKLLFFAT